MSLVDLPDVLIAHLCSYLEYPDICNLMETSKKNYNAIKGYKKDKLVVDYLSFESYPCFVTAFNDRLEASEKRYKFNGKLQSHDKINNMLDVLNECSSIEDVRCDRIDDDFCKVVLATKTHIKSVRNIRGSVYASPEQFIPLCQKIKSVYMKCPYTNGKIFTDEVFIKCRTYMDLEFEGEDRHLSLKMTDRTLEDLVEKNVDHFSLYGVTNAFTTEGSIKAVQTMLNRNIKSLYWNLGVLLHGQQDVVDRYFNSRNGELRNQFKIEVEDDDYYHITDYQLTIAHEEVRAICISFEVSQR